jgi:hypothetical protein
MRGLWLGPMTAAVVAVGCAPTLDWREVRVAGAGLVALFPCKPVDQTKQLPLAGTEVQLTLSACVAGGSTWAVAHADVVDPARVGPALTELLATTAAKASSAPPEPVPWRIEGVTPNEHSQRVRLAGRRADGSRLPMQMAVFARGTRVFQATWLGDGSNGQRQGDAVETFFAGLRVVP